MHHAVHGRHRRGIPGRGTVRGSRSRESATVEAIDKARDARIVRVMKTALVATALALLTAAAALAAGPSRLIQTNAKMQRLGTWRIDESPTLGGARRTLGEPSNCRRIRLEDGSIVRWSTLGVHVVTA